MYVDLTGYDDRFERFYNSPKKKAFVSRADFWNGGRDVLYFEPRETLFRSLGDGGARSLSGRHPESLHPSVDHSRSRRTELPGPDSFVCDHFRTLLRVDRHRDPQRSRCGGKSSKIPSASAAAPTTAIRALCPGRL